MGRTRRMLGFFPSRGVLSPRFQGRRVISAAAFIRDLAIKGKIAQRLIVAFKGEERAHYSEDPLLLTVECCDSSRAFSHTPA